MEHPPLYLSAEALRACLSQSEIFDVVTRTMRDMATSNVVLGPTEVFAVEADGVRNRMGTMAGAIVSEGAAGLKWFFVPGREGSSNLPHVPATILVSNIATGFLDGVMDATFLTVERTAAMGVAAALAAVRRPIRKAAIIGAGFIGRAVAKYLIAESEAEAIVIASRSEETAKRARDEAAREASQAITFHASTDVRSAVANADLVITATAATYDTDIVRAEWLKSDVVICSLGSAREVDLELMSTAFLVVHDVEHVALRRSDLREGGAGWNRKAGDVATLMDGSLSLPGVQTRIHIIVGSIGALDIALGARALVNARRTGLGIPLR